MFYQQVQRCLDILNEYPSIKNYINCFNGANGFIYTVETDIVKKNLQEEMNRLLDDGTHSGASWGIMLRTVQSILNGVFPYEEFIIKLNQEKEEHYNRIINDLT